MPDRMPERMSEYMPDGKPQYMPDRLTGYMSETMPEHISVECRPENISKFKQNFSIYARWNDRIDAR